MRSIFSKGRRGKKSHTPQMATAAPPVWLDLGQLTWTTGDVINLSLPDYIGDTSPEGFTAYIVNTSVPSPNNVTELGLTLSSAGIISGTIDDLTGGTYNFIFDATNLKGTTISSLTVTVVGLEITAPTFTGLPDLGNTEQGASVTVNCADPAYLTDDGNPQGTEALLWQIDGTSDVLTGHTIGVFTGVYTVTIDDAQSTGPYDIVIKVTNQHGFSTTDTFIIPVISSASAVPQIGGFFSGNASCDAAVVPSWKSAAPFAFDEGEVVSIDMLTSFLASNGGAAITGVALASGSDALPAGMTLATSGGSVGFITGDADAATAGVFNLSFTATNSAGTSVDSEVFVMTITNASEVTPALDSIDVVEDTADIYFNYSEPVDTSATYASDYTNGFSCYVNNVAKDSAKALTYVSGGGTARHKCTVAGVTFSASNTIVVDHLTASTGLKSVSADQQVADASDVTYVVPIPPSEGIILSDGFETGDLSGDSGYDFNWGNSASGALGASPLVSSDNPKTGTYSLKFRFIGGADGTDTSSEQRFGLGGYYSELWAKFDVYIPSNYNHRNSSGSDNNKAFMHTWSGISGSYAGETRTGPNWGPNFWPAGDGGSNIRFWIGSRIDGVGQGVGHYGPTVNCIRAEDFGHWMTITIHAKQATIANDDGVYELWRTDWQGTRTKILDIQTGPFYGNGDNVGEPQLGFNYGYLMGWANSGFDNDTNIYYDNVAFSTDSLL